MQFKVTKSVERPALGLMEVARAMAALVEENPGAEVTCEYEGITLYARQGQLVQGVLDQYTAAKVRRLYNPSVGGSPAREVAELVRSELL